MSTVHAAKALMPDGWRHNVRVTMDDGKIVSIECDMPLHRDDECHSVVLPGMPNLHSHAFQRGMAGLAERRGPSTDSFWSWRDIMYRFAHTMSPDDVEIVARQLYIEMLEAGFTRVGEFHYLHHAPDGGHYSNIAEMAVRIIQASNDSGIGMTLLPVFYAHSGFGGAEPNEAQRRFISSPDQYHRLLEKAAQALRDVRGSVLGIAPHSLRAVTKDELKNLLQLENRGPLHIHIAEQMKEVEDCLAWSGQRPVEWLMNHMPVDENWCLIHATHMTDQEVDKMALSGAIAGLCPITEANLGDGIFRAARFMEKGGRFGVGSDSNVLIGLADELRQLEYSQRLSSKSRNVLAASGESNGRKLFDEAYRGGTKALGLNLSGLVQEATADLVTLNMEHPSLSGREEDQLLDTFIFSGGNGMIDCVWAGGCKQVANGKHVNGTQTAKQFRSVMKKLQAV